jgi:uncharacterized coiled-coil protein SlyX
MTVLTRLAWEKMSNHFRHSVEGAEGTCITEKVRYPDDLIASEALERVRQKRLENPDDNKDPERTFYECRHCSGWHLSSSPPAIDPPPAAKADGETWEEYAHRLEHRIKKQRDILEKLNSLRADAGNRSERKRMDKLRHALGMMTERWEAERTKNKGLIHRIRVLEGRELRELVAADEREFGKISEEELTEVRKKWPREPYNWDGPSWPGEMTVEILQEKYPFLRHPTDDRESK